MGRIIEALYGISTELKERILNMGEKTVPVNYYTRHNNWGDQLNKYLIEKITNKKVVKNNFKKLPHILAIGSVLSSASNKSIVWGVVLYLKMRHYEKQPLILGLFEVF